MSILVIAEHDNDSIKTATLNTVTAAQAIGDDVHVLVAGLGCQGAVAAAAEISGVTKVINADAKAYAHQLPENVAPLLVELAKEYSHILSAATTTGKNLMPRAAALLDVAQISDIIEVKGKDTFVRPVYAGNAMATVQSSDSIKMITVRTTAYSEAALGGNATIESCDFIVAQDVATFISEQLSVSERPTASVPMENDRKMTSIYYAHQ